MWCGMATRPPCFLGQTLRKHRRTTTALLTCHNLVRPATWLLQTSRYESRKRTRERKCSKFPPKMSGKNN